MSTDPIHDPTRAMDRLLEIMRRLRDPQGGCPWDLEQSFATIAPYTIEEAYEVADAIEREAWDELKGELGDLLFQSVFHAQMAAEQGLFTFDDVANTMSEKMLARHPHVFGPDTGAKTAEDQTRDWEAMKARERAAKAQKGTLDGVAMGLPALTRAIKLQNRAARVGFDWPDTGDVLDKLLEEAQELRTAATEEDRFEEFGDLLFVMANLARHMKIDPEEALRAANSKFIRRFQFIESALASDGRTTSDSTLEEMDRLWDAAKAAEKAEKSGAPKSGAEG